MKLKLTGNNVETGGATGAQARFGMNLRDPKMFRILSDGLYEDKVGSMIRELSCNAVDAHAAAGRKDTPFTIHLPDSLEPWFSVTDMGVGLDDEDIRGELVEVAATDEDGEIIYGDDGKPTVTTIRNGGIYTSYGVSTKDNANDAIGAFGLGSKTPFAYCDQFTIVAVKDGVRRTYTALWGEDGFPSVVPQGEEATDAHAGVSIMVPVRDGDFNEFRQKVTQQLRFLPVKPVLENNRNGIEFDNLDDEDQISIDKDGVRVYNGGYHAPVNGIHIVQGGVGYPLNIHTLGKLPEGVTSFANAIEGKGAILEFPIGDIEVTASREGISYTETVIDTIVKRLSDVAEIVCRDAMVDLRAAKNLWERVSIYNNLLDVVQKAVRQSDDFDNLFAAATPDKRGGKMSINADKLATIGYKAVYIRKHTGQSRNNYSYFERPKRETVAASVNGGLFSDGCRLYPEAGMTIIIRDTNSKPMARIKHFVAENDWPTTLIIEGVGQDASSKKEQMKIAMALGLTNASDFVLLSSLPAPVTQRNGSGSGERRPRGWFLPKDSRYVNLHNSKEWNATYDNLDDLEGQIIYIGMDRHHVMYGPHGHDVLEAVRAGAIDMDVIAVNQQTMDRIKDGKVGAQLIDVDTAYKLIEDAKDRVYPVLQAAWRYKAFLDGYGSDETLIKALVGVGAIRSVASVQKRIAQLEERAGAWGYLQNAARSAADEGFTVTAKEAGEARRKELFDKYPMLNHVDRYDRSGELVTALADYIKMVDERG